MILCINIANPVSKLYTIKKLSFLGNISHGTVIMFQKKKKKAVRDYKYILRVANQKKKNL